MEFWVKFIETFDFYPTLGNSLVILSKFLQLEILGNRILCNLLSFWQNFPKFVQFLLHNYLWPTGGPVFGKFSVPRKSPSAAPERPPAVFQMFPRPPRRCCCCSKVHAGTACPVSWQPAAAPLRQF